MKIFYTQTINSTRIWCKLNYGCYRSFFRYWYDLVCTHPTHWQNYWNISHVNVHMEKLYIHILPIHKAYHNMDCVDLFENFQVCWSKHNDKTYLPFGRMCENALCYFFQHRHSMWCKSKCVKIKFLYHQHFWTRFCECYCLEMACPLCTQ